jgi:hypothetical protein
MLELSHATITFRGQDTHPVYAKVEASHLLLGKLHAGAEISGLCESASQEG